MLSVGFQNDSGHVEDTRWNAMVKKNIQLHYFPGTGKRHGLVVVVVVVSGMALGEFGGEL